MKGRCEVRLAGLPGGVRMSPYRSKVVLMASSGPSSVERLPWAGSWATSSCALCSIYREFSQQSCAVHAVLITMLLMRKLRLKETSSNAQRVKRLMNVALCDPDPTIIRGSDKHHPKHPPTECSGWELEWWPLGHAAGAGGSLCLTLPPPRLTPALLLEGSDEIGGAFLGNLRGTWLTGRPSHPQTGPVSMDRTIR